MMNPTGHPLAVVTGATGGIGKAICLRLAEEGYDLLCIYQANKKASEALRLQIESYDVHCSTLSCDLSDTVSIETIDSSVEKILRHTHGDLKTLVNGAALLLGPSFIEASTKEFDKFMSVNVRAPFFLAQHLSRRMYSGGSIVNISSAGAHFSSPGDIVYSMTKAALESMTFHAAEALAEQNIRINTVIPGFTDNGHELFQLPEARAHMASFAVLGDISDPNDVAEAVEFLISERASRITGTTLDVSGGSTLGARPKGTERISLRSMR